MQTAQKLAFVTGASGGIGHAIALRLLAEGYAVACGYYAHKASVTELAKAHPTALAVRVDIHSRASICRALKMARAHYGIPVTIVVNNAGIADERPFAAITDAEWDRVLETNLRGAFIVTQEVLHEMQKMGWGRIINIVSIGGQWGGMRQVHYAAAKAGLISFTHSMAKLYSASGITSNAVAPGLVATDMIKKEVRSKHGKAKIASIPIGRLTTPEEVAGTVAFLASDDAASITGQTININGGLLFS